MKKKLYKPVALLLAFLMLFGTFAGTAAAVAMPAGVDAARVKAALPKVESVVGALMKMSPETADLSASVYKLLFSDDTLNGVFTGVYTALADQGASLSALGLDLSPARVAQELADYPEVVKALTDKADWTAVFAAGFYPKWNVATKERFSHAMAAVFGAMNELLFTLLCGGTYRPNVLVSVQGANGYENALVPVLQALGTPDILSQAAFTADAQNNRYSMVKNICQMLYSAVDSILASPVQSLCRVLPRAADYLTTGGLSASMTTLVEPLKVRVGLVSLTGVDKMLEQLNVFSSSTDLTKLVEDMDTSALFGADVDLTLPKIDLEQLAACGVKTDGQFVSDEAAAFVVIFRWAMEAVKLNAAKLPQILGQDLSGAQDFLNKFLARDADSILKMLLDLMDLRPADTVLQYQWTYPPYAPGTVEFTPNLTREDYVRVLTGIDSTLNEFMTEFTEDGSLSGMLAARLYSGSLVSTLVKTVYGMLGAKDTAPLMAMLGVDATPAGLAARISGAYPAAARALRGYSGWEQVNPAALSWGFSAGSKQGFVNALTAVLAPFRPFLTLLLAEGDYTILDTVTLHGSNGYNTAVLPLLEALGCTPNTVKTYDDYKRTAGTDAAIGDILTPVTDLMDTLISSPVATMCALLPNLVYFVNAGGLTQCMENLMYPVRVLLRTIGAEDLLGDALNGLTNVDLNKTVSDLIANAGLNLKLPEPDLSKLASLGAAETRMSKRTLNGMPQEYVYIAADSPAVLITVLRYVVGALGSEENAEAFSGLFAQDQSEEGDMMAMYTGKVAEQLKTMSTDETIEWLYNLLFAETPKRENAANPDAPIPTIIYQEREKHTGRNVTAIVIGLVVFVVAAALILSRIDFGAWKERRRHRKNRLKAIKQQKNAPKPPLQQRVRVAEDGSVSMARPAQPNAPARQGVPMARPGQPNAPAAERQGVSMAKPTQQQRMMNEKERLKHERELIKMRVREEKAQQKALRDTKKADKYYEQALKEQRKNH